MTGNTRRPSQQVIPLQSNNKNANQDNLVSFFTLLFCSRKARPESSRERLCQAMRLESGEEEEARKGGEVEYSTWSPGVTMMVATMQVWAPASPTRAQHVRATEPSYTRDCGSGKDRESQSRHLMVSTMVLTSLTEERAGRRPRPL